MNLVASEFVGDQAATGRRVVALDAVPALALADADLGTTVVGLDSDEWYNLGLDLEEVEPDRAPEVTGRLWVFPIFRKPTPNQKPAFWVMPEMVWSAKIFKTFTSITGASRTICRPGYRVSTGRFQNMILTKCI